jgi:alkylated DNA nucleotide flippase Atl1
MSKRTAKTRSMSRPARPAQQSAAAVSKRPAKPRSSVQGTRPSPDSEVAETKRASRARPATVTEKSSLADGQPTLRKVSPQRLSPWQAKMDQDEGLPKVQPIGPTMRRNWGEGTVVTPTPREVDGIMKLVPQGKVITIQEIRAIIAKRHGATIGCPVTTGIFARIAAHAAEEEAQARRRGATPYWRTLMSGGYLNEKYPGGVEAQRQKLEAEGHSVIRRGEKLQVEDYEEYLAVTDDRDR